MMDDSKGRCMVMGAVLAGLVLWPVMLALPQGGRVVALAAVILLPAATAVGLFLLRGGWRGR